MKAYPKITPEETKAIEDLRLFKYGHKVTNNDIKTIEVILKLLTRQQEEIMDLKNMQLVTYNGDGDIVCCMKLPNDVVSKYRLEDLLEETDGDTISKNKIKNLLKEIDDGVIKTLDIKGGIWW